jgi:hypothetical protein
MLGAYIEPLIVLSPNRRPSGAKKITLIKNVNHLVFKANSG